MDATAIKRSAPRPSRQQRTLAMPRYDVSRSRTRRRRAAQTIEWADQQMPVLRHHPRALRQGAAAQGPSPRRLPAHHQRDRQPAAHAQGGRRRGLLLRLQSALDPGRRRRGAGQGVRHPDLRDSRRRSRHLLQPSARRARAPSDDHDGRRRRPRQPAAHRFTTRPPKCAPAWRRPPPASSACARWSRTAR